MVIIKSWMKMLLIFQELKGEMEGGAGSDYPMGVMGMGPGEIENRVLVGKCYVQKLLLSDWHSSWKKRHIHCNVFSGVSSRASGSLDFFFDAIDPGTNPKFAELFIGSTRRHRPCPKWNIHVHLRSYGLTMATECACPLSPRNHRVSHPSF